MSTGDGGSQHAALPCWYAGAHVCTRLDRSWTTLWSLSGSYIHVSWILTKYISETYFHRRRKLTTCCLNIYSPRPSCIVFPNYIKLHLSTAEWRMHILQNAINLCGRTLNLTKFSFSLFSILYDMFKCSWDRFQELSTPLRNFNLSVTGHFYSSLVNPSALYIPNSALSIWFFIHVFLL